jgi:hypothetical protein
MLVKSQETLGIWFQDLQVASLRFAANQGILQHTTDGMPCSRARDRSPGVFFLFATSSRRFAGI